MVVDDKKLIHGGFVFGLADYSAMLAVNEETVVLSSAEIDFINPVGLGETLESNAYIEKREGKKFIVPCTVKKKNNEKKVLEGKFSCIVPENHVLD